MEGVTFALRQALEACESVSVPASTIVAAGGGASSDFWLQMIADVLNRPVSRSRQREQAGLGAGLLAGVGTGIYGQPVELAFQHIQQRCSRYDVPVEPQIAEVRRYEERYQQFTALYGRLVNDFHLLAR
jgi:xylulokinase